MKKNIIAFIVTGLAVCMLSGCAGKSEEPVAAEPVVGEQEAEAAAASEETEAEPEKEEPAVEETAAEEKTEAETDADTGASEDGYAPMWVGEKFRKDTDDLVFDEFDAISFVNEEGDYSALADSLKKADWDNDGIYEYCYCGDINFPGIFFDMIGDELTAVEGYGPYSMGWNGIAYIDGAYMIYDASGNYGKHYQFDRYDADHERVENFWYEVRYDEKDDGTEEVSYKKGKDAEEGEEISEDEFNKMCGEKGTMNDPVPELEKNADPELTDKILEAAKEFFEGKRPAIVKKDL